MINEAVFAAAAALSSSAFPLSESPRQADRAAAAGLYLVTADAIEQLGCLPLAEGYRAKARELAAPEDMGPGGTQADVHSWIEYAIERLEDAFPDATVYVGTSPNEGTEIDAPAEIKDSVRQVVDAAWEDWCGGQRERGES